jgi:hypothetical protein
VSIALHCEFVRLAVAKTEQSDSITMSVAQGLKPWTFRGVTEGEEDVSG